MSRASWKREFFGSMREAVESDLAALKHAERKWEGLLPENLEKHGRTSLWGQGVYFGVVVFEVSTDTCALCKRHNGNGGSAVRCIGCPLLVGGRRCDRARPKQEGPYEIWFEYGDPRPMLRLIRRAIKRLEAAETSGEGGRDE